MIFSLEFKLAIGIFLLLIQVVIIAAFYWLYLEDGQMFNLLFALGWVAFYFVQIYDLLYIFHGDAR
jgi:hypothetical protein